MGKVDLRLAPAQKHYMERYHEHVKKAHCTLYATWTMSCEQDWEMIRKLTLHMFNCTAVAQLKDEEVILANQITINITNTIYDQIDVIGHTREQIENKFKVEGEVKGEKNEKSIFKFTNVREN